MAKTLDLASLQKAAAKKYKSTELQIDDETTIILKNPLSLSTEQRDRYALLQNALKAVPEGDAEDTRTDEEIELGKLRVGEWVREVLRCVAGPQQARKLNKALGDDDAQWLTLHEIYNSEQGLEDEGLGEH